MICGSTTYDVPVNLADLSGRVEETLQDVREHDTGAERDPHTLDGVQDGTDNVRRSCR